ncbi:hypothetical protein [Thomasclavelia cocleata]|uniref:hypothetical protein n=1 Tax=Thomasclavelia cocleata TaxID=69824 RepID=UPI0024307AEC|nr:hypothetical protein [Thomasclavelia cocleata]
MPKARSDKGCLQKLNNNIKNKITNIRTCNPRITTTSIYIKLIENGDIHKQDILLSTVSKFIASKPEL